MGKSKQRWKERDIFGKIKSATLLCLRHLLARRHVLYWKLYGKPLKLVINVWLSACSGPLAARLPPGLGDLGQSGRSPSVSDQEQPCITISEKGSSETVTVLSNVVRHSTSYV